MKNYKRKLIQKHKMLIRINEEQMIEHVEGLIVLHQKEFDRLNNKYKNHPTLFSVKWFKMEYDYWRFNKRFKAFTREYAEAIKLKIDIYTELDRMQG